jgi:hypothetical protein
MAFNKGFSMNRLILLFILILSAAAAGIAQTFEVEHAHRLRSCKGKLVFGDTTVDFTSEKKKHSHSWKYEDIQQLDLDSKRVVLLTYDRRKIELGADQSFTFKLLSGTIGNQFRVEMEKKLARPLVSSVLPEQIAVRFSIPARHRLVLNSTQGVLEFGDECMIYRSEKADDSRIWRYKELESIGSTGPFQLRIGALEKDYVFDLKRLLLPEEYDFIWLKVTR